MELKKRKIIIDTDVGDDFDDAFALALAARSPEFDILGVVTVFKDVTTRCKEARAVLDAAGRSDIKVYKGNSRPIKQTEMLKKPIDFNQKLWSYIDDCEKYQDDFADGEEFYVKTLEQAKEPITIITLGAMTNVGKVLKARPDLAEKIDEIVVMGGAYDYNYSEYNFLCDPEAADIIMSDARIRKVLVGLDVTFDCHLDAADLKRLAEYGDPLTDVLTRVLNGKNDMIYLHDPLAVYCAIDKSKVTFKEDSFKVETTGEYTRGYAVRLTNWNWQQPLNTTNSEYGCAVDAEGFIKEYIKRVFPEKQ